MLNRDGLGPPDSNNQQENSEAYSRELDTLSFAEPTQLSTSSDRFRQSDSRISTCGPEFGQSRLNRNSAVHRSGVE